MLKKAPSKCFFHNVHFMYNMILWIPINDEENDTIVLKLKKNWERFVCDSALCTARTLLPFLFTVPIFKWAVTARVNICALLTTHGEFWLVETMWQYYMSATKRWSPKCRQITDIKWTYGHNLSINYDWPKQSEKSWYFLR